eukprot:s466_g22.t2
MRHTLTSIDGTRCNTLVCQEFPGLDHPRLLIPCEFLVTSDLQLYGPPLMFGGQGRPATLEENVGRSRWLQAVCGKFTNRVACRFFNLWSCQRLRSLSIMALLGLEWHDKAQQRAVTHVHVMNPHPRTGQRCAFVFYATRSAGEDACEVLDNQYKIRSDASQPIVVRWSKDSTQEKPREKVSQDPRATAEDGYKLFVGSLPPDCTSEELRAVFSTYGVVTHVHVMNPHPRSGQRCAFVFYTTKSAGDDACKVLDNQYKIRSDASQPIVVRWSKEPTKEFRPKESFAPNAGHWEKGSQPLNIHLGREGFLGQRLGR